MCALPITCTTGRVSSALIMSPSQERTVPPVHNDRDQDRDGKTIGRNVRILSQFKMASNLYANTGNTSIWKQGMHILSVPIR
jgi:hypothetical protein